MKPYLNKNGNSGVTAYEIGKDWIVVAFGRGERYLYSYKSAGKTNIEQMKKLAAAGLGLSTFISKYVKDEYEEKL